MARGCEDATSGCHQQSADDQHAPAPDPIGTRRQIKRHEGVTDERQRQEKSDLWFGETHADEIKDEDDRQRSVGEQTDEARREQQVGLPRRSSACKHRADAGLPRRSSA